MVGAISIPQTYIVPRVSPNLSRPSKVVALSGGGSSYWASVNSDIEDHLNRTIQLKQPLSVYEPLRHFAFAAPPPRSHANTAPALCVAAYELVGGPSRAEAVAAAAALRLLYAVSYTHETLLELSGPKPVTGYDRNVRLMMGDAMVPFAMEMLAGSGNPDPENSGRVLRVVIEATRAIGSQGVVERQYRETLRRRSSDGGDLKTSGHVEEIRGTSEKLEGGFHACSAASGAILGGGSEDEIDKLRSYGSNVGKIQTFFNRRGDGGEESGATMKEVEEMRDLAVKELSCFEVEKVEALCALIDFNLALYV